MKQDETHVYLWFMNYGDDAAVVTRLLGIEPTFIGVPDQPNARFPKMTHRIHKWQLCGPLDSSFHIEQHLAALLHLLEPHSEAIKAASKLWNGGINAAIYYQDSTPGIHLSAKTLELVAHMNLSIDLDLYFLQDENG